MNKNESKQLVQIIIESRNDELSDTEIIIISQEIINSDDDVAVVILIRASKKELIQI